MVVGLGTVWVWLFFGWFGLLSSWRRRRRSSNNNNNVLHILCAFYSGLSSILPEGRGSQITNEERLNTREENRLSKAVHWQNWEEKVHFEQVAG